MKKTKELFATFLVSVVLVGTLMVALELIQWFFVGICRIPMPWVNMGFILILVGYVWWSVYSEITDEC